MNGPYDDEDDEREQVFLMRVLALSCDDLAGAIVALEQVLGDCERGASRLLLALLHRQDGNIARAVDCLKLMHRHDHWSSQAGEMLAGILAAGGESSDRALVLVDELLRTDPRNEQLLELKALALRRPGRRT